MPSSPHHECSFATPSFPDKALCDATIPLNECSFPMQIISSHYHRVPPLLFPLTAYVDVDVVGAAVDVAAAS